LICLIEFQFRTYLPSYYITENNADKLLSSFSPLQISNLSDKYQTLSTKTTKRLSWNWIWASAILRHNVTVCVQVCLLVSCASVWCFHYFMILCMFKIWCFWNVVSLFWICIFKIYNNWNNLLPFLELSVQMKIGHQ
jgi:hypothetical protein